MPTEMVRKYRKGISISKFANFKQVMENLHMRMVPDDQRVAKTQSQSCHRSACRQKAATFYAGPDTRSFLGSTLNRRMSKIQSGEHLLEDDTMQAFFSKRQSQKAGSSIKRQTSIRAEALPNE